MVHLKLFDYVGVVYTSIYEIINAISLMSNNLEYVEEFFDLIEYQGFGDSKHGSIKLGEETLLLSLKTLILNIQMILGLKY